jgi:hypothetical protein
MQACSGGAILAHRPAIDPAVFPELVVWPSSMTMKVEAKNKTCSAMEN